MSALCHNRTHALQQQRPYSKSARGRWPLQYRQWPHLHVDSANGMVRPCSRPTGIECWEGTAQ
jgi:hypothetical protein